MDPAVIDLDDCRASRRTDIARDPRHVAVDELGERGVFGVALTG
jgi:hypothetical protein